MHSHWFRTEDAILHFTPDRVRFFEVSASEPDSSPKFEQGFLRPEEIEDWLKSSSAKASDSFSTLRILFGECRQTTNINVTSSRYNVLPFSRPKFDAVAAAFCVPPEYVWAVEEPSSQVAKFRLLRKQMSDPVYCEFCL